jgi:hypothetical protein
MRFLILSLAAGVVGYSMLGCGGGDTSASDAGSGPDSGPSRDSGSETSSDSQAGGGPGCYTPTSFDCQIVFPSASVTVSEIENTCRENKGTSMPSCPTAGLLGCCTIGLDMTGTEVCTYSGSALGTAADQQASCTASEGSWSTTP